MNPRNIVGFSAKPELLVDSAVDEEVQGRIDSKGETKRTYFKRAVFSNAFS